MHAAISENPITNLDPISDHWFASCQGTGAIKWVWGKAVISSNNIRIVAH